MNQTNKTTGASVAVFGENKVLLVLRGKEPMKGYWSLPGGGVEDGELPIETARRELAEETAIFAEGLEPVVSFNPHRIKNGQVIVSEILIHVFTTTFYRGEVVAGDDADAAMWVDIDQLHTVSLTPRAEEIILKARAIAFTET